MDTKLFHTDDNEIAEAGGILAGFYGSGENLLF